jgi:hypothetical protein
MAKESDRLPDDDASEFRVTRKTRKSRRALFMAAAVLVVVLVAVIVGYLILGRGDKLPLVSPTAAPPSSGPEQAADSQPPRSVQLRAGDQARAIIAEFREQGTEPDFPTVYARAEQFQKEGMLADSYLLHFFAAREGYAPSALTLGSMYDPNHHTETVSLMEQPDPEQAFKWYTKAAEAGETLARDRLDELRGWVERSARAGDAEAQRLLMQW